ncbi:MAG: hypothetical protein RRA45_00015 [Saccharolobus sp.]|uniref:hypothetical protein n=1 Tax=Saccharolobus sp. TaxID=2100761 RepID=UPI0028CE9832|nr:hypothetical protein [Saccharolobus sp.]MDT7860596.1 hypothetical protein [Saccharolobus sp.]
MLSLNRNSYIPWLSLFLLFISYSLSNGIYITVGRVTYYPVLKSDFMSILLTILSILLLTLYNYKYAYLIPLSLLSFFSPSIISLILIIPVIFSIRRFDVIVTIILILADSTMLTWVILRLLFNVNSYFSLPLSLFEIGAPALIPIVWIIGIIFYIFPNRKNVSTSKLSVNIILPFIVTLLIALIPYMPNINPPRFPETVDFVYYYSWLVHPKFSGWFFYTRPFYLMLLYIFSHIFKPYPVAYYEFVFLSIFYIYSAYKLASAVNRSIAPLSALLASVSPMLITFLYSGLEANLFSISLMFISLSYLMRKEKLWLAILLSLASMFSHIYAWAQLSGAVIVYYILKIILHKTKLDKYELYYMLFLLPFVIIGFSLILIGIFPVPIQLISFSQLVYQIKVVSWGSNNAFLYYLISSYGNRFTNKDILSFIYSISVIGIFFLAPATNLIIDLPLFIPAAYTLNNIRKDISSLLLIALILWGVYMSINSVPMVY